MQSPTSQADLSKHGARAIDNAGLALIQHMGHGSWVLGPGSWAYLFHGKLGDSGHRHAALRCFGLISGGTPVNPTC